MANKCRTKSSLRNELVNVHKVIDNFNNILDYNAFSKVSKQINNDFQSKYSVKGKPIHVYDEDRSIAVLDEDYLKEIDVIRGIDYGENSYVPYQETFIGSMLSTYETKDLSLLPLEVGNIVSHKNDVFIFLGYTESGLKLYTPHPLEGDKIKYISADEIEVFQETTEFVTFNKQKYIVFRNDDVLDEKEIFHKDDFKKNKVLEMRSYLRNLDLSIEDVTLQLYENSYKTLPYKKFVEEVSNINKILKYNYSNEDILAAIKCY